MSDKLGIPFETPIKIHVDKQTTLSFATRTVKKSKLRHIDARQDWVQALRDATVVKLAKVHTSDNLTDLGTKLVEPDTFEGLHDRIMVNRSILKSKLEQPSGTGSTAQGTAMVDAAPEPRSSQKPNGREDELSDAPTVCPSDSGSRTEGDGRAQTPAQTKRKRRAVKPAQRNRSTGTEEAKGNTVPGPQAAGAQKPKRQQRRRARERPTPLGP